MNTASIARLGKRYRYGELTQYKVTIIALIMSAAISLLEPKYKWEYVLFIGTSLISLQALQSRHWIKAALVFSIGMAWGGFYNPLTNFINNIGTDSFAEAKNFDMQEARFWIATLSESVHPEFKFEKLAIVWLISIAFFSSVRWLSSQATFALKNYGQIILAIAATAIVVTLQQTVSSSINLFLENSESILSIESHFKTPPPPVGLDGRNLDLVVYIGESTSIMNMGLYGYPRDTTPKLDAIERADRNLIVFKNTFSTHTHTTPSLLEALSFGVNDSDRNLPIEKRRRLSVANVLVNGGIDTTLFSNQGMTGTWNQASSVIFAQTKRHFSTNSRLMGNNDPEAKPWDHEFLISSLEGYLSEEHAGAKRAVFLHSYAGHGPYLQNIPPKFRKPVDAAWGRRQARSQAEGGGGLPTGVDEYDCAIRYVDFSVAESIRAVRNNPRPTIFIYFSDHGDAAYAGVGHDSARFIHEMVRVPLLLYFNDAAKHADPALYEKYKAAANQGHTSTLAQIPATLLDLLGVRIQAGGGAPVIQTPVIGAATVYPSIVLRETVEGVTFLNINRTAPDIQNEKPIDKSDDSTRMFVATTNKRDDSAKTCYDRADTLGKALRGRLVADCLEMNLVVEPNGELNIYRPPERNAGFSFVDAIELASRNRLALWIDGTTLGTGQNCSALYEALSGAKNTARILVEFPSGAYQNKAELYGCTSALRNADHAVAYNVPANDAIACSQALANGRAFESEKSCLALQEDLRLAVDSGLFSDFSFDYPALKAMEHTELAGRLRWNTRNVSLHPPDKIDLEKFGMVIFSNADPNNL